MKSDDQKATTKQAQEENAVKTSQPLVTPKIDETNDLQAKIEQLEQHQEEIENKYKRVLADYQNLERRMGEDQQRFVKVATQLFVEQLLTPYDHLLMAAKHINDKGLDLVIGQFKGLFDSQGLKEVAALGKQFDPTLMEAIETKDGENDKVLEVLTPGYELHGVIIRPARVVVGKKEDSK